ncbi:winged helix-turn-helix transcriptional regulator [Terracidiphilus gabretensis]|uniref:winged helix-turn-helix transcriptional regulator n=1 Tax=Terracidiphilus gabretensis TaxID=1577687 RepID=UPI00071BB7F6|nr:helix-turn-helix domain-containing protein [Terracidiphilus gabretensis]
MKKVDWEKADAMCDKLSAEQDVLVREIVTQISEKWTLWTMSVLARAGAPMRFSRVMEEVEGISQKSLTKTLRQLERGGLVTREVFAEVPPRVEYKITKLGEELLVQLHPMWLWTVTNVKRFEAARLKYAGNGRKNPWTRARVSR